MEISYRENKIHTIDIGDLVESYGDKCLVIEDHLNDSIRLLDIITFGTAYTFVNIEELRECQTVKLIAKSSELELIIG